MKACAFLPAATRMIYEMGLEAHLHGVTFECPADRPVVVHSVLEGNSLTSDEIEAFVSAAASRGESLYSIDMELLREIDPDVIFTQHVCDVCQIGTSVVERAVHQLERKPQIVPLVPRRLEDIFDNAVTVAAALGHPEEGVRLVERCRARMAAIAGRIGAAGAARRRVMVMEWLDPVYNCGHWIPDQIAAAGGTDPLGNPGGYSVPTEWEAVLEADPEVLVVAPCGFDVHRARGEVDALRRRPGWDTLRAVREGGVFLADADLFTCPSTSVVDGIELLAALFHPALFGVPPHLSDKVLPLAEAALPAGS